MLGICSGTICVYNCLSFNRIDLYEREESLQTRTHEEFNEFSTDKQAGHGSELEGEASYAIES